MADKRNIVKVVLEVPEEIDTDKKLEEYINFISESNASAKVERWCYRKSDWPSP